MATLTRDEIGAALTRLGELAQQQNFSIELLMVGGAAMVLAYDARVATRDVDAVILSPRETRNVRVLVERVAHEQNLPIEWLNDGAKGYLVGQSQGITIFSSAGIVVYMPAVAQMLAMKLAAWRDDVDIADARLLLNELSSDQNSVWALVEPYVLSHHKLKARYAFDDLWEATHDSD